MMRTVRRNPIVVLMLAAALVGGNVPFALAVDGVVLIDQNRALAGNVTPGDAPGFPVTITKSGSYRLSGNLTVPDENTTGIEITADNVTLDLNGFFILGPTVCSSLSRVTTCAPTGSGIGVDASFNGRMNVAVVNGTVQGMGRMGVALFDGRVEKVYAASNGGRGIEVLASGTVVGNTARTNLGRGISTGDGSTMSGNKALFNGLDGIQAGFGSTVTGNTALINGGSGIRAFPGNTVIGNTAMGNDEFGLELFGDDIGYTQNVLSQNQDGSVSGGTSLGQNLCNGVIC